MNKFIAIFLFTCKTIYFSPVNNPACYIIVIISVLLFVGGSFGKHEIMLMLLVIGISNRFMPGLKALSDNVGNNESFTISQCYNTLPVNKISSVCGYLGAAVLYALLLIGMCIKISTMQETPPLIGSLCLPKVHIKTSSQGETREFVEGLMLTEGYNPILVKYSIPLSPSIFYHRLASDVIIGREEVSDSVVQSMGRCEKSESSISEYFKGTAGKTVSNYYSPLLTALPKTHFKCIVLVAVFIFMFFIIDTIKIAKPPGKKKWRRSFMMFIPLYFYSLYALLGICLISDILLPESIIWKINSLLNQNRKIVFFCWGMTILFGSIRGMEYLTNRD